jgi:hypothetical protein
LKYNYDPGSELYNEFINVCNIDSDHTSFPVSSGNWQSYVTGVPDSAYSDASNIWTECINSFKDNQVTQIASTQISELPWYVDAKIFDSNATNGTGTTSSAFYYLKFLGYWTTRLKDVITYSIPITTNTVGTDILDCVTVKNAVYTDGTARTGWIVSRELDAVNDLLILQAMLLPADMSTSLTKFDYLDERPDKNVYIDSLDQRSAGTDSLTE